MRAGKITIVREGSGTGEGVAPTPGQAHEFALKGAETDATKRALATFGNAFGLKPASASLGTKAFLQPIALWQDLGYCDL